ncbi:rna ligase cyclic nucleotide phosphodiesterase [Diplodia corticola]|uniref:Rna ligase cyclic nucleotide phosphodiesterase n=1 Tax=Diplodia corticola TaxID=236234 RepID=A0A1J9QU78_9PEZI|nr:rna ligase cyclic nucleotide phosphodiesterase [Diplodia corticola]OJD32000.1 rna ligase cyclic nucleotide phosphodiesterase [Diplodia corticola]
MAHQAMSYSEALSVRQRTVAPSSAVTNEPNPTSLQDADTKADPTQRERKADHQPRTSQEESAVYVLTLSTTASLSKPLTVLRDKHFPIHLNHTAAHLTMFHALPGSEMTGVVAALEHHCRNTSPFRLTTGAPFRMKRGVGIRVGQGSKAAQRVHEELQQRWADVLSAQDRESWRPHWTVQNKVDDEVVAEKTFDEVQREFQGAEGLAKGCTLWRYESGGRWKFERDFDFGGGK